MGDEVASSPVSGNSGRSWTSSRDDDDDRDRVSRKSSRRYSNASHGSKSTVSRRSHSGGSDSDRSSYRSRSRSVSPHGSVDLDRVDSDSFSPDHQERRSTYHSRSEGSISPKASLSSLDRSQEVSRKVSMSSDRMGSSAGFLSNRCLVLAAGRAEGLRPLFFSFSKDPEPPAPAHCGWLTAKSHQLIAKLRWLSTNCLGHRLEGH